MSMAKCYLNIKSGGMLCRGKEAIDGTPVSGLRENRFASPQIVKLKMNVA